MSTDYRIEPSGELLSVIDSYGSVAELYEKQPATNVFTEHDKSFLRQYGIKPEG